jgi:hypothetical protein
VTEGGCDPVEPGNASLEEPETRDDNESLIMWRLSLKEAILTTSDVPPVLSEVYDRLENIFKLNQGNEEAISKEINNFIVAHLYETIRNLNQIDTNNNNKSRNKPQKGYKKNSRNARKRCHTLVVRTCSKNVQRSWPMSLLTTIAHT